MELILDEVPKVFKAYMNSEHRKSILQQLKGNNAGEASPLLCEKTHDINNAHLSEHLLSECDLIARKV